MTNADLPDDRSARTREARVDDGTLDSERRREDDLLDREARDRDLRDDVVREGEPRDADPRDPDTEVVYDNADGDGVYRSSDGRTYRDTGSVPVLDGSATPRTTREEVLAREQDQFGGIKFGSAFFGWLTATGTAVLLTALIAGIGAAVGFTLLTADEAADAITGNEATAGLIGAVAVLLVLFIAYFCGGYVAGRMARFSGARQGLAVWLWAIIFAIVVAVIGAVADYQFDLLSNLNAFPRIPIDASMLTVTSIVTVVLALGVSLLGAVLGGISGMRYHRAVDRAGLGN